jgi:hypothetical protein
METPQTTKESSIQLNIDSLISSKKFGLFYALILSLLAGVFLLASNSPDSLLTRHRSLADPLDSVYKQLGYENKGAFSISENPILSVQVTELSSLNKFVAVDLTPLKAEFIVDTTKTAEVEVSAFTTLGKEIKDTIFIKQVRQLNFDCSFSQVEPCTVEEALRIPITERRDYYFVIKFLNNDKLNGFLDDFQISTVTLNLPYRIYLFAVKLVFLLATVAAFFWHSTKMKQLGKDFYTPEQKTFNAIAPILIAINEPFSIYILEGTLYSWAFTIASITFGSFLVYYWLSLTHEMAGSDSSLIETKSKFAKYYTVVYFGFSLFTYLYMYDESARDPTFKFGSLRDRNFDFVKLAYWTVLLVGLGWILSKMKKVRSRTQEVPERQTTYFWFSSFFALFFFYISSIGGFYPFSLDGSEVILFCGVSTLYLFATTYLYLPTKEGIVQAQHLKKYDNPAVKDSYKDLEASVDHKQQQRSSANELNTHNTDRASPAKESNEAKYPYEVQHDDDI